MNSRILFFLLICGILGCEQDNDDLSGTKEINGKLYLYNPYDSLPKRLLAGHELFIQKDTAALPTSFLYSTKSDKDGYFIFKYLYDTYYKIHAEMKTTTRLDNDILFSADSILKSAKNTEIVLGPDFQKQNGLYIVCTDTASQPGAIPGDSIYIYTSKVLAANDTALILGAGSSYSFTTRVNGTAFKMNLPHSTNLYINTACTFGNKRLKSKLDMISLSKTGVDTIYIKLE